MICNNIYSLDSTSNHISLLMNLNFNVSQIVKIKLSNIEHKLPLQMSCISQVMPTLLNHPGGNLIKILEDLVRS